MTRQEYNLEICKNLIEFFNRPEAKDLRFYQALYVMETLIPHFDDQNNVVGVGDPFPIESKKTHLQIMEFLSKCYPDG